VILNIRDLHGVVCKQFQELNAATDCIHHNGFESFDVLFVFDELHEFQLLILHVILLEDLSKAQLGHLNHRLKLCLSLERYLLSLEPYDFVVSLDRLLCDFQEKVYFKQPNFGDVADCRERLSHYP